jgi:hypothetical protein
MRLIEFYNPELDEFVKRSKEDTRKSKLTLEELGKLRKVRDLKTKEKAEHDKFVKVMYANQSQDAGGGLV